MKNTDVFLFVNVKIAILKLKSWSKSRENMEGKWMNHVFKFTKWKIKSVSTLSGTKFNYIKLKSN